MRRLVLVDTAVLVVYHAILVLSVYLLFAGHNQAGGGFAGGLVAGSGLALRFVAGGREAVRGAVPARSTTFLGLGLAAAATTALVPVLLGGQVLEHDVVQLDLPLVGTLKATTALPFDIGVYLLVIGVVVAAFDAFGGEPGAPTDEPLDGPDDEPDVRATTPTDEGVRP